MNKKPRLSVDPLTLSAVMAELGARGGRSRSPARLAALANAREVLRRKRALAKAAIAEPVHHA